MLITCPYCGPRDVVEFTYQGDANRARPDPMSNDPQAWTDYVFQRVNTAGPHREYWQHSGGCRAHLVAVRDTTTHEISSVNFVRTAPAARTHPAGGTALKANAASRVKPKSPSRKPATKSLPAPKGAANRSAPGPRKKPA